MDMQTLEGGPADGYTIPVGRKVEWLAYQIDDHQQPVPILDEQGRPCVLPAESWTDAAAALVAGARWACYRRTGSGYLYRARGT